MGTTAIDNKGVTADVAGLLNSSKGAGREVTADLSGGTVSSSVSKTGDTKIFEAATKQMGKEDFLTLLVTQMRYQDPLAPQDNQQFVAQLAQFSSLEGTQNINKSIEDLGKKLESMVTGQVSSSTAISNASATNLMGKYVRVNTKDIAYTAGQKGAVEMNVHSDNGVPSVLTITDADGEIINMVPIEKNGDNKVSWNGTKMDGSQAKSGNYTVRVTSKTGAETGYAYFENKVTGISYAKSGMRLDVNGQSISIDQVAHVGEAPTTVATK